jgi:hypothetical protein
MATAIATGLSDRISPPAAPFVQTSDGTGGSGTGTSVIWTAKNREHTAYTEVGGEVETAAPDSNRDQWDSVFTTHSTLQYTGVEWIDNGGVWEHSFLLQSWAVGLRPLKRRTDDWGEESWIPAGGVVTDSDPGAGPTFDSTALDEFQRDRLGVLQTDEITSVDSDHAIRIKNAYQYSSEGQNGGDLGVFSVNTEEAERILSPSGLVRLLSGRTGEDELTRERVRNSLRSLTALSSDRTSEKFTEVFQSSTIDYSSLRRTAENIDRNQEVSSAAASLGVAVALTALGAAPVPIAAAAGVAGLVLPTLELIDTLTNTEDADSPNSNEGGVVRYPDVPQPEPAAGHVVQVKARVPPDGEEYAFSVRNRYEYDLMTDRGAVSEHTESSAWVIGVRHDETTRTTAEDRDQETPVEKVHTARPLPIDDVTIGPEGILNSEGEDRIADVTDKREDLATFRPSATFTVVPVDAEQVVDTDSVLSVKSGTDLQFDLAPTQIGHAIVQTHELFIETYAAATDEWVDSDSDGIQSTITRGESIDRSADVTKFVETVDTAGYYRASLRLIDENDETQVSRHRFIVEDGSAPDPTVHSFNRTSTGDDAGTVRFEVDAEPGSWDGTGDPRSQLAYLWGVAPTDDDRFDPQTTPSLRESERTDRWTFDARGAAGEPRRIWVLVVDPATGRSTLRSVEYGRSSRDPDGDGLREDVNGDGRVDENDVTALEDVVESRDSAAGPDTELIRYDFTEDRRLNEQDIAALFDEVNEG